MHCFPASLVQSFSPLQPIMLGEISNHLWSTCCLAGLPHWYTPSPSSDHLWSTCFAAACPALPHWCTPSHPLTFLHPVNRLWSTCCTSALPCLTDTPLVTLLTCDNTALLPLPYWFLCILQNSVTFIRVADLPPLYISLLSALLCVAVASIELCSYNARICMMAGLPHSPGSLMHPI